MNATGIDSAVGLERTPAVERSASPNRRASESTAAASTFATNVGVAMLSLVSITLVARALGPSGRGSVALLTTIVVLTQYIVAFGVQEANANIGSAEPHLRARLATNSSLLALLFGGCAIALLGVLMTIFPGLVAHLRPSLVWLALATIPVTLAFTYLFRLVQTDYRFAAANVAWISAPLVTVAANTTLFTLGGLDVRAALLAWIAGQASGTLLLLVATQRMCGFGRPDLRLARRMLAFGVKIHPATILNFANYRLDQWLLGTLGTSSELGLYSIAVSWAEALFFLPTAVTYAQRPALVRATARDSAGRAALGVRLAVLLTLPLVLAMVLAAPLLCVTVFGGGFRGSVPQLRILAFGAFGILMLKMLGNALTAQGRPLLQSAATAAGFACTVVLDVLLIPRYGGIGASIASTAAYSVAGAAIIVFFLRTTGTRMRTLVPGDNDLNLLRAALGTVTKHGLQSRAAVATTEARDG